MCRCVTRDAGYFLFLGSRTEHARRTPGVGMRRDLNIASLSSNHRWKSIWVKQQGDKEGQLDEEAAGVRVHGWWKDLRKDFRVSEYQPLWRQRWFVRQGSGRSWGQWPSRCSYGEYVIKSSTVEFFAVFSLLVVARVAARHPSPRRKRP